MNPERKPKVTVDGEDAGTSTNVVSVGLIKDEKLRESLTRMIELASQQGDELHIQLNAPLLDEE